MDGPTQRRHPTAHDDHSWKRVLRLPDNAAVDIAKPQDRSGATKLAVDGKIVCAYRTLPHSVALVISAIGTPFEQNAEHIPKYPLLELLPPVAIEEGASAAIEIADLWGVLYVLHTLYHAQETIPIVLSPTFVNAQELTAYLLNSGLARKRHTSAGDLSSLREPELFLSRETFWQGAGTVGYHTRGWLRGHAALLAAAPIPYVQSFTRTPTVIAAHPLRPPKPRPGEVLYRKYCPMMGHMLEFTHVEVSEDDSDVSAHLATFHRWHNSDHVNRGWGERGPMEKHRAYLRNVMVDPGTLAVMMSWDGELMGYSEFPYIKENHLGTYVPGGVWDYDRGLHILVGEKKFRGIERSKAWMSAIHHFLFLSDPRTMRVIGEPKAINEAVILLSIAVGMNLETAFDFPYKRSVMTWMPRLRFFKQDVLAFAVQDDDDKERQQAGSAPGFPAKL